MSSPRDAQEPMGCSTENELATDLPSDTPLLNEFTGTMVIGQVAFDKYRVERKLGEGGMGAVWLVQTTGLRRKSALKLIRPEIAQNDSAWQRFEREAQMMAKLNHPHIVTVYDYRRTDSVAYIEMEYVRGKSVHKILNDRPGCPMEPSEVALILDQLCTGLQEAHGYVDEETREPRPIIHRDLKPANLMLVNDKPRARISRSWTSASPRSPMTMFPD